MDTLLRPGDVLLLSVDKAAIEHLRRSKLFLILSDPGPVTHRTRKMMLALAIMGAVVAVAALGIAPIVVSALVGAIAMVVTGCLEIDEAYEAIDWRVLFLLGGMLALGAAMESSGAAKLIAHGIVEAVGDLGPRAIIAALYLLTAILTEAMSNNATVVLMAPIAIETAQRFGIDPRPLVLAVMFAASTSFMTPVGYQTNTMIYGPGQFRFFDFARVGAPLNLLFWGLAIVFIPWFFPL
jgi:di/tricarboxylate transporter